MICVKLNHNKYIKNLLIYYSYNTKTVLEKYLKVICEQFKVFKKFQEQDTR